MRFFRWLLIEVHSHLSTVQLFTLDFVQRHVKQRREVIISRSQSKMLTCLLVYQHSISLDKLHIKRNRLWLRNQLQARVDSMLDGIIMIFNFIVFLYFLAGL